MVSPEYYPRVELSKCVLFYGRIVRRDLSTLTIGVSRIREEMEKDAGIQEQMRGMTKELDKQISK